jgi:hypothetical protein
MTAIMKTKTKEKTKCLEERQQKRWRMGGPRGTKIKGKREIKIKNLRGTLQGEILRNPGKRRNQRQVRTVQGTGVTAVAVVVVVRRKVMVRGVRSSLQSGLDLTTIERLEERRNAEKVLFSLYLSLFISFIFFTLHLFPFLSSRIVIFGPLTLS